MPANGAHLSTKSDEMAPGFALAEFQLRQPLIDDQSPEHLFSTEHNTLVSLKATACQIPPLFMSENCLWLSKNKLLLLVPIICFSYLLKIKEEVWQQLQNCQTQIWVCYFILAFLFLNFRRNISKLLS